MNRFWTTLGSLRAWIAGLERGVRLFSLFVAALTAGFFLMLAGLGVPALIMGGLSVVLLLATLLTPTTVPGATPPSAGEVEEVSPKEPPPDDEAPSEEPPEGTAPVSIEGDEEAGKDLWV